MFKTILLISFLKFYTIECFTSASIINYLTNTIDALTSVNVGKVSNVSYSHEDIIRLGCIRSVARFFYDHGGTNVDINNLDKYTDLLILYRDYYGRLLTFKGVALANSIAALQVIDIGVDTGTTGKLALAHFDSEQMEEGNERVITLTASLYSKLNSGNYTDALTLTGQVLHTIQDFYSHTNWVEMGNTNINKV
jgi:hypothetical protein